MENIFITAVFYPSAKRKKTKISITYFSDYIGRHINMNKELKKILFHLIYVISGGNKRFFVPFKVSRHGQAV